MSSAIENNRGTWNNSHWENAHRWHARHSLPNTTEILFHENKSQNRFEGRTNNQYIGVNFTFRTHSNNGLWDIPTYTGATSTPPNGSNLDTSPNNETPLINQPFRNRRWWFRPRIVVPEPDRGNPHWADLDTPIVIFDYSRPAQADRITIGTH